MLVAGDNRIRLTFRSAAPSPGASALRVHRRHRDRRAKPAKAAVDQPATPSEIGVTEAELWRSSSGAGRTRSLAAVVLSAGSCAGQARPGLRSRAPSASVAVRVPATVRLWPRCSRASQRPLDRGGLDLAPFAGQAVRLDLCAHGRRGLGEPRLMVRAAAPAVAGSRKFDHIYVWMIDTFRADKMHAYNPRQRADANYDAFAADARVSPGRRWRALGRCRRRRRCSPRVPRVHKPPCRSPRSRARCPLWPSNSRRPAFARPCSPQRLRLVQVGI